MKTLYRSQTNKKIAGVCAGFAEYFELDAALIRIIWLSAILLFGTGILLYLICWLIMPPRPENNILVPKALALEKELKLSPVSLEEEEFYNYECKFKGPF